MNGRSMRGRMLAGEPYRFDEPPAGDSRRCRVLLERINAASCGQDDERDAGLGELLGALGREQHPAAGSERGAV